MPEQESLVHQPAAAGLWRRFTEDGAVAEGPWLRACNEGGPVGECSCGSYMFPRRPEKVASRTDYTADCRACGREVCAPGGRLSRRHP